MGTLGVSLTEHPLPPAPAPPTVPNVETEINTMPPPNRPPPDERDERVRWPACRTLALIIVSCTLAWLGVAAGLAAIEAALL